ncbi:glutamate-5-semialdehyde dehydrogenase [Agrococcus sp. Marseille-Q4369]|uniref:glutamate-5-semialdehyde dehydrogenase n=1 Tax=Agrococcus sp. Marseille-Q4369 TaxID=2810513 RepID=UPI001B8D43B0|nr:glutamate-5-semialdehyde dehydrogenase [Agrococcus sp. Marseille-Q4369]QUW19381.1 glutamate-5-semialdehyde dehydrogenase [Agrococcus sp. Marseille-Q4369]
MADDLDALLTDSKQASRALGVAPAGQRHEAIRAIATAIERATDRILAANAEDLERGRASGLADGLLDRLLLDERRIAGLAAAARALAELPDPIGEVLRERTLPNGLELTEVRVPFGVVGVIYEARPNVTVDLACIGLGSGNAVVLRGGSAAERTNAALVEAIQDAVAGEGLPREVVQTIDRFGRDGAGRLMRARGLIDLLVPRGSAALIDRVVTESTVPVIETGAGVVHAFVDRAADLPMALDIVLNAKTQRTSVCNALETVLVHRDIAETAVPTIAVALQQAGVTIHADGALPGVDGAEPLRDGGWATEHLSMDVAIGVVDDLDAAIEHVNAFGTHHTDTIITDDADAAARFLAEVDSAVVMHNASTRFTDGGEFGFGAEVGISTQKAHARGPMGLPELTSTKWIVRGSGQVRA